VQNQTIEEFYKSNILDDNFDEISYLRLFPETLDFYQPYCKDHNITEKERLYYHYSFFGKNDYSYHDDDHALLIHSILVMKEDMSEQMSGNSFSVNFGSFRIENKVATQEHVRLILTKNLIKILKLFKMNRGLRLCQYYKQRIDILDMLEFLAEANIFSSLIEGCSNLEDKVS